MSTRRLVAAKMVELEAKPMVWMRNLLSLIGVFALLGGLMALADTDLRMRLTVPKEVLLAADAASSDLGNESGAANEAASPVNLGDLAEPSVGSTVLTKEQRFVARWLARKYRVAVDAVQDIVLATYDTAKKFQVDPHLLLAVMSIESGFNPLAESPVGAQGLMQVMTKVHTDKFKALGSEGRALDPITNIHVGSMILRDYLQRSGGNMEGALKLYVGAGNGADDAGYGGRVIAERNRIKQAAAGKAVPFNDGPATVAVTTNLAPKSAPSAAVIRAESVRSDKRGLGDNLPAIAIDKGLELPSIAITNASL